VLQPRLRSYGATAGVGAMGVVTSSTSGKALGYFVRAFLLDEKASPNDPAEPLKREYFDYICTAIDEPEARGVGRALVAAAEKFGTAWGSASTSLTAAWLGRYRWAIDGFDFETPQIARAVRRRFDRFAAHHQLDPAELVFDRGNGVLEPYAPSKLKHAWDYAQLRSTERKLHVPTHVGPGDEREDTLDVGRAFLVGNAYDPELGRIFAPASYHAERPTDPASAGQQQASRYRARLDGRPADARC
jgi:hypothetical protein